MRTQDILQHSHLKEHRKYGKYSQLRYTVLVKNIRTYVAAPMKYVKKLSVMYIW